LYEEVTHVPLILIPPFLLEPGIRVETTISNADLWPTLLDIVGLPALESADGVSMLPLILEAGGEVPETPTEGLARPVFAQLAVGWGNARTEPRPIASVTWAGMRGITRLDRPDRFELYDREADPKEANDLFSEHPEVAEPLRVLLSDYASEAKSIWGETREQIEVGELRLNQLRALGYEVRE
jgi:arylsulfatase A-like enzyme